MAKKASTTRIWVPTADDVIRIHLDLTKLFERESDPISPPGIKNKGLLESACGRPSASFGGIEKYQSLVLKLAALTQSITKNHAFHNGNKRAAFATLLVTLYRNSLCLKTTVSDDDVFNFIVSVTADEYPIKNHGLNPDRLIHKIAWWIKSNTESYKHTLGTIRISDFVERCRQAGMSCKVSNGGHIIMNPIAAKDGNHKSIKISSSTRQISGPAANAYIRKLGLNAANSGIDSNEFYDGMSQERKQIHRFIVALRRLAKT